MQIKKYSFVSLMVAFSLIIAPYLAASNVYAEQLSSSSWSDKVYKWYYNPSHAPIWLTDEQAHQLLITASKVWEVCGVRIEYQGDTSREPGSMDGVNVVGWSLSMPAQVRGLTNGRSLHGQIVERDIQIRPDRLEFKLHPRLLRKVISHEFGHAIGLSHSASCGDVMTLASDCPGMNPETLPLIPTEKDLAQCKALYLPTRSGI